jgi:hypothetical protein
MARTEEADLAVRCFEREARYLEFVRMLGAGHSLTRWSFTLWHDAEYARSIQQGYYDPRSPIVRRVLGALREKGIEYTAADLDAFRTRVMDRLAPVISEQARPVEFGYLIRCMRRGRELARAASPEAKS